MDERRKNGACRAVGIHIGSRDPPERLYDERNLIERFFSILKRFRRVATRCDKPAANFLATLQLASLRLRPSL